MSRSIASVLVVYGIMSLSSAIGAIGRANDHQPHPNPPPIVAEKPIVACPHGGQWVHVPNDGARWTLVCKETP